MTFYWGPMATILFDGWVTTSYWELFGSCLVFVALGMLYEFLAHFRITLIPKTKVAAESETFLDKPRPRSYTNQLHILITAIHFVQLFLSYIMMLGVMCFNVAVLFAVCIGYSIGFFIWGRTRVYESPTCH